MRHVLGLFVITIFALAPLSGVASQHVLPGLGVGHWQSSHFTTHPLVGTIVDHSGNTIDAEQLIDLVNQSQTVLVGEVHDNPDHHELQAALINTFKPKSERPVQIVIEMVPDRLQSELDRASLTNDPNLEKLGQSLEWEKRGWYSWAIYKPIFNAALLRKFKLTAGSLNRAKTREISKKGLLALTDEEQKTLGLNQPLTEIQTQSLRTDMKASHCGLMPDHALPAMALVQRARDGALARAMNAQPAMNSILIAGNGHVRKDRGVPILLNDKSSITIGLIEVSPNHTDAEYYIISSEKSALYDFAIFTPKFDITDHCAEMRKKFKPKKN